MAKLTQHDKDLRDAKIVKGRVTNIRNSIQSLHAGHWDKLTHQDGEDLQNAIKDLDKILERLKYVQL